MTEYARQHRYREDFTLLVKDHQAAVRAFVTARIDDPYDAQDIAQEVFIIAYQKLPDLDLDRPIRPWLWTIATNKIRNYRRKKRAQLYDDPAKINEILDHEVERLEDKWQHESIHTILKRCLSKLGEHARSLIRLRYEEGLGIVDICRKTGGKHSATTMRLFRLRSKLKECIESHLDGA